MSIEKLSAAFLAFIDPLERLINAISEQEMDESVKSRLLALSIVFSNALEETVRNARTYETSEVKE